jgi:phosphatidylglycerol lysyltransferase
LRDVSDEWLATKSASEKGFSVGFFDDDYLKRFPVAVMERNGRVEVFTNLWLGADHREISPDLMRYRATAPPGVMDALFARVMEWSVERRYVWFNLGMAPLAGLPVAPASRVWMRAGHFVYRHGEAFYNFQGVRSYKSKFDPVWRPRYLAYPGGLALARVVTDVASLIAGGYMRMFLRTGRRAA